MSNFVGKTKLWYTPNDPVNKFGASTIMSELAVSRRLGDSMEYLEVDTVTIDSLELAPELYKNRCRRSRDRHTNRSHRHNTKKQTNPLLL